MNDSIAINAPVAERINQLDILRGFALLGILIMNIQAFSMPFSTYINPTLWGDLTGTNQWVWIISNVFADLKFMSLFSILFGAGICLFADKAMAKTGNSTGLHYRRNLWLLLFGLLHGYLIWFGDILVPYALTGFIVYLFRNKSSSFLIKLSSFFLFIMVSFSLLTHYALTSQLIPEADLVFIENIWTPSLPELQNEVAAYIGSYSEQFNVRFKYTSFLQTQAFISGSFWRIASMMLLGMALYKNGVLTGKRSNGFYFKLAIVGLVIGLGLSSYGVMSNFSHNFSLEYSMMLGAQFNFIGSVLTCLGYIAIVNLLINYSVLTGLQKRLAAVGQMAFTNYIFHSLVCTSIFYGFGLGLFGALERIEQIMIVLIIWAVQLWYSPIWLQKYRFGPLEWLWRSLTYWQKQPFLR